jgi:drug/metabolite transporter (DMT)-like permease
MAKRSVPLAILGVLFLNEAVDGVAQYCFKKTALAQGQPPIAGLHDAIAFAGGAMGSGYFWLGLAAVALVFVTWITVLSKIDLSAAMPITSFSYVFVALAARLFLHEAISPLRWAGIVLILVGVAIVSWGEEGEGGRVP